ncbi:MAG: ATP-binding protein [Candidatus Beckwithbacteria bacterium]|nr:ATP-binding protein [Candidatus Beckwithbacteria bacterium]
MKLSFGKKKPPTPPTVSPQDKFSQGITTVKDIIAPGALEVDFNHLKIANTYFRTLFVSGYPRFVNANWLAPLINFEHSLDISMYIYPVEGKDIMDNLRRKIGEMEAEVQSDVERGRIAQIGTKVKLEDAKKLEEQLAKGAERFFQFGLYVTVSAKTLDELNKITQSVQSTLGSLLIIAKSASLQMEAAFQTTLPLAHDRLMITRNMDTTSLATTFPFTSSELTQNQGVLYGINEHNGSLIILDRFSLENANSVIFAKSGAGKSYLVKLEALRSLMFETEIIIIDPENEYQKLCSAVGGEYIDFSFNSKAKINPFDLSQIYEEGQNELSQKVLSLHSLFKVIMGQLSPQEEALLDRAIILTYKQKNITPDPGTQKNEPPLLEDLYKVLIGMEESAAENLAARLEKFVKGSFRGIFDQHTNINLQNTFTVFSLKELEDALRPVAMFMVLDFVWTKIKKDLKKRLLIVDEAWYMMKYPDSASFLYSMAKRARKYYLGLTTVTQDVEDFLGSDYGKAIVTNSSIQILMKQSTASIEKLGSVFFLSEGEKHLLLAAAVGHGLIFAGQNHVALKVVASPNEHSLITSNPAELLEKSTPVPPPVPATSPVSTPSSPLSKDRIK